MRTALFFALCACGTTRDVCDADELPSTTTCDASLRFAARGASSLLPAQSDVDRYYDRWKRTLTAEPILTDRVPQSYRNRSWPGVLVWTTNPGVTSAWKQQSLPTGVPAVDDTLSQFRAVTVDPFWHDNGDGSHYFTLHVESIYNEEILDASLRIGDAWLSAPVVYSGDDGTWTWTADGETAEIQFKFGWGDCFVACSGYRTLLSVVPVHGPARVYDLGGDPLPDSLHLSDETQPR